MKVHDLTGHEIRERIVAGELTATTEDRANAFKGFLENVVAYALL